MHLYWGVSAELLHTGRSIKQTNNLEWMGSMSHGCGAELRRHSLTVDHSTFSNEETVAEVVTVTCIEVELTGPKEIFALCLSTLLLN